MQYELNVEATSCLERLEAASWFARLGEPLNSEEVGYELAKDMKNAIALSKKRVWDEVIMEYNNDNVVEIFAAFPNVKSGITHPNYNDYASEVNNRVKRLIEKKTQNAANDHCDAARSLSWLLHNCIISYQFKQAIKNDFFFRMEKLILTGRYPCGWTGKTIHKGKVVVF